MKSNVGIKVDENLNPYCLGFPTYFFSFSFFVFGYFLIITIQRFIVNFQIWSENEFFSQILSF